MPFSLASPAWLLGLIAVGIPVALHLWSRRPSQLVRLGSLDHLQGAPGPRSWGRQFDDLPLLATRILLLMSCILGLAGVRWSAAGPGPQDPAFLVVADPALVADSVTFFNDPLVDSLRRAQAPIHLLQEGLPLLGTADPPPTDTRSSLWSLLGEWDANASPGSSILVVARPRASQLGAVRPALASQVLWHSPAVQASGYRIVASWAAGTDSVVRLVELEDEGRLLRSWDLAATGAAEADGAPSSRDRRTVSPPGLNDRSGIVGNVQIIVIPEDTTSLQAVRAALSAVLFSSQGFVPRFGVSSEVAADSMGSSRNLIVWLNGQSDSNEALNLMANGNWVVEFIPSDSTGIPAASGAGGPDEAGAGTPPWVRPLVAGTPGAVLRADASGLAWATVTSSSTGRWFRIGTAGNASAMLGDTTLPQLLYDILSPTAPAGASPVAASQATPGRHTPELVHAATGLSLSEPLLVLAALLLALERVMAHSRRRAGR